MSATLAALLAAVVAILGWNVQYLFARRLKVLDANLGFIGQQLSLMYGPLRSLVIKREHATAHFQLISGRDSLVSRALPPPEGDALHEWYRLITDFVLPLEESIDSIVHARADLIVLTEGSDSISFFTAHYHSWSFNCARLNSGAPSDDVLKDLYVRLSKAPGLEEFTSYVKATYDSLKDEQTRLLGVRGTRVRTPRYRLIQR